MSTSNFLIRLLLFLIYQVQPNIGLSTTESCPSDCICYKDYMSNLASWKWIETDINIQKDDPQHEDFNPYTDHNEVFDNPAAVRKRQNERLLETVTCILRRNSSESLAATLKSLHPSIQVLSLIQAPGSGNITLEKAHLENLHSLIGLEVQGYKTGKEKEREILVISADAFSNLKTLKFLSMDTVALLQRSVQNQVHEMTRTILRFNYKTDENVINNEIPSSQVILLQPMQDENENSIVPYSVFKSEHKVHPNPVQAKISVAFTGLPTLQHLKISGCNLQDISWDMFHKLDNLKFLLLDQNDLLFLPDFVFFATSNLTALSLSRNRILNLQTVGLAGLLYLQKLDVSHNNITHLSELSLPPFPHLEVADFRHNPIESIFPNTFEIMNSTKTLFLGSSSTAIEFLPNSFYGLIALNRLDIMNVRIGFLERPMFIGMAELTSLTMTGTISRISYDAFTEVPKLEKLILKECSIQKISMDAFFGLSSLIELDLSHNEIAFLPPGLFDQQLSLREVFLQYNKLKTLPPNIFNKIPAKLIRLEKNPWHCSCDMKYWEPRLTNQVKRYYVPQPNSTYCQKQYDKGTMCYENYDPTFQVKYVYEKRVSPVCKVPAKFSKRSVFDVLRKELHYCANSLQQNISIILTATNPLETIDKTRQINLTVTQPPISVKEMEKQLLFPVKVKKPAKPNELASTTSKQLNTVSITNISGGSVVDHPSVQNVSQVPQTLFPNANRDLPLPTDNVSNQSTNQSNSKIDSHSYIPVSTVITTSTRAPSHLEVEIETAKPPKQKSNKSKKNGNKRRNQDRERDLNNHAAQNNEIVVIPNNQNIQNINLNIYPPISKKALKLAKYNQKLLLAQQQG